MFSVMKFVLRSTLLALLVSSGALTLTAVPVETPRASAENPDTTLTPNSNSAEKQDLSSPTRPEKPKPKPKAKHASAKKKKKAKDDTAEQQVDYRDKENLQRQMKKASTRIKP